jgi:hypothetical protein
MRQPVMDVASHVVLDVLPRNHTWLATLQSRLIRPHGCFGMKYEPLLGWMTVERVRFHVGVHVGGGHGTPFFEQVGLGGGCGGCGGEGGAQPPGGCEQCATAAIALTVPGQGSPPWLTSEQFAWPTHVACA